MISFLSKGMALFLLKNKVIDDETCEVCQYGFEIIVSTIIGFVLVMLIGLFFSDVYAAHRTAAARTYNRTLPHLEPRSCRRIDRTYPKPV